MEVKFITANENITYLGELDYFKSNPLPYGIFNKKDTGCGATSVALENDRPTIIAMPTTDLIDNKVSQYPNERSNKRLLAVYAGVGKNEIQAYVQSMNVPKICCTYDAIPKLSECLDLGRYDIVVDEYHELLKLLGTKDQRQQNILRSIGILNRFEKVSYISATPLKAEFTPDCLKNLPYTEMKWERSVPLKVVTYETNKPCNAVVNIILDFIAGNCSIRETEVKELYFFVNSVSMIKKIVESNDLVPFLSNDNVKIVCSDSPVNRRTLDVWNISKSTDQNKPINFITSTAFQGSDFYTPNGLAIVVSESFNEFTLADVSTEILQIAGRLRNKENPFKDFIVHVFSSYNKEFEDYISLFDEKKADALALIETLSKQTEKVDKDNIMKPYREDKVLDTFLYYDSDTDSLKFNDAMYKYKVYRAEVICKLYKDGISLRAGYMDSGATVDGNTYFYDASKKVFGSVKREAFKDGFLLYARMRNDRKNPFNILTDDDLRKLEGKGGVFRIAYEQLGEERVRALSYKKKLIEQELSAKSPERKNRVFYELKKIVKTDVAYLSKDLKQKLKGVYNKLGISQTAKIEDLGLYFDVKRTTLEGAKVYKLYSI